MFALLFAFDCSLLCESPLTVCFRKGLPVFALSLLPSFPPSLSFIPSLSLSPALYLFQMRSPCVFALFPSFPPSLSLSLSLSLSVSDEVPLCLISSLSTFSLSLHLSSPPVFTLCLQAVGQ